MRQGEIWIADLDPTEGSEQAGRRPVVIISGDILNAALPIVIVAPLSSSGGSYRASVRLRPNLVNGLDRDTKAMPFQVRTLAKSRFKKKLGEVSAPELNEILRGLFLLLTN